jgi:chorismate-pyruvate lyase
LIIPDRLSADLQRQLDVDGEGLGRILLNNRLETYREVLWYGKEHIDGRPEVIRHLGNIEFLSRAYRIIANGKPIMLITEKFLYSSDQLPFHE